MDEDACMVDVAQFFMEFGRSDESCGKCPPCRVGTRQMLNILERIKKGEADLDDLKKLEELSIVVPGRSLCGLGQSCPQSGAHDAAVFPPRVRGPHPRTSLPRGRVPGPGPVALCASSCPLHMNIPGFLQLLKEERLEEAFELVVLDNPLPPRRAASASTRATTHCRRATVDSAVNMREVHRFIADSDEVSAVQAYRQGSPPAARWRWWAPAPPASPAPTTSPSSATPSPS